MIDKTKHHSGHHTNRISVHLEWISYILSPLQRNLSINLVYTCSSFHHSWSIFPCKKSMKHVEIYGFVQDIQLSAGTFGVGIMELKQTWDVTSFGMNHPFVSLKKTSKSKSTCSRLKSFLYTKYAPPFCMLNGWWFDQNSREPINRSFSSLCSMDSKHSFGGMMVGHFGKTTSHTKWHRVVVACPAEKQELNLQLVRKIFNERG